jgi:hypothetical protein
MLKFLASSTILLQGIIATRDCQILGQAGTRGRFVGIIPPTDCQTLNQWQPEIIKLDDGPNSCCGFTFGEFFQGGPVADIGCNEDNRITKMFALSH